MKNPFTKTITKVHYYNSVWDPFKQEVRYYTEQVVDTTRVVIASVIAGIVLLAVVISMVLVTMGNATNAVNYTTETTVAVQDEIVPTTTTVPVRGEYVCNMPTSASAEYNFMKWSNGDLAYLDFPSVNADVIVFEWNIDQNQEVMDTFHNDIEEFGKYVGKQMRVELPGYIAQAGEFVVPVVFNKDASMNNADYSAYILWSSNFLFGTEARFTFNPDVFSNIEKWNNYHHVIVLHELGHLFGLDHTHIDDDGIEQHDSIMSYEGIWDREGLMPGDIAGLQQIFCS